VLAAPYRGKLFGVEPLQGQVVLSDVFRDRSFVETQRPIAAITTSDQWFRPVDISRGRTGAIYVADMYEQRIDHYRPLRRPDRTAATAGSTA